MHTTDYFFDPLTFIPPLVSDLQQIEMILFKLSLRANVPLTCFFSLLVLSEQAVFIFSANIYYPNPLY